jgi:hypothetical protein
VEALCCARQFAPAAALAAAWAGTAAAPALMERVARRLAQQASLVASGSVPSRAAAWRSGLGESLGRLQCASDAPPAAEELWAALRSMLQAHGGTQPRLQCAAADAALQAAPGAPLPGWLRERFTRGAGADVAALLRLLLRHGQLAQAATAAAAMLREWEETGPLQRAAPEACAMPLGAMEAILAALRESGEARAHEELQAALQKHLDGCERDAKRLRKLHNL